MGSIHPAEQRTGLVQQLAITRPSVGCGWSRSLVKKKIRESSERYIERRADRDAREEFEARGRSSDPTESSSSRSTIRKADSAPEGGRRAKSSAVAPPRGEVRRAVEFDGEPEKDEPKRFKHDEGTPQAVESDLKRVKLLHGRSDVILRTRLGVGEKMKQINSTF